MKVLMVTPSFDPIVGGSESTVRLVSTMLNQMGIQTDVMTLNMNRKWKPILRWETENNGAFKVFKVPAFNLASIFRINPLELLRVYVIPEQGFARKFKDYDIIHFQGEADLSLPLFSYFVRKPKIFTSHANFAKFPRLKSLFMLIFPRLADLYTAYKLDLLSDLGVPRSRSLALPFGVDVEAFRPDETKKLDNLILFVGRITEIKGLHVLLEALRYVESPTQLVIIGPRGEWDMKYAESCMNTIKQMNSMGVHSVKYLGAMDESSLVPWYQKAAVLVRPDLDGFSGGLTSLEALSCSTPVIGTGNHVIKNGVNGLVVPPNDAKELAKAIDELLRNKELREECGMQGRKMVEKQFSWEAIVKTLVKVYEVMLSNY